MEFQTLIIITTLHIRIKVASQLEQHVNGIKIIQFIGVTLVQLHFGLVLIHPQQT